jgi:DNA-binding beta-propeller fold protein YncE
MRLAGRGFACAFVLLTGCAGGGAPSSALLPATTLPGAPTAKGQTATAQVVIKIPQNATPRSTASLSTRRPAYVSAATQSIAVQVDSGRPTVQNLSATSANCALAGTSLDCTVPIPVASGAHQFTFITYDQPGAVGKKLSTNSVASTIVAQKLNTINVTLAGIPASLQMAPVVAFANISGSATAGFTFFGGASPSLLISALDADGNYIVGPGAPTLAVSLMGVSAGSGIALTASGGDPNEFTLASVGLGTATLAVVATPASTLAGRPLTANVSLSSVTRTTTIAGAPGVGHGGFTDGTGTAASFLFPTGLAYDSANGNLYVTDQANCAIRQVTTAGVVSTIAGAGQTACTFADGTGSAAKFNNPTGLAFDSANDNLYVADQTNCAIRQVTTAGVVTTIAGTAGNCGSADGTGSAATFNNPSLIAYDSGNGDLYVTDTSNCAIRQVTTAGIVTTIAGAAGSCGFADGTGASANFNFPIGIAYDSTSGNLYVTDTYNCAIRQVTTAGVVTTIAGAAGSCHFADGTGTGANFNHPQGIAYDPSRNDLDVTDTGNFTIRQVNPGNGSVNGGVVTTIAGSQATAGFADGIGTGAHFNDSAGIAVDATTGRLYVTDTFNEAIRQTQL